MTAEQIGRNIRAARERRKWTQKSCAAKLPCAPSTWSEWESGENAPQAVKLPAIARLLGTTVARLLA